MASASSETAKPVANFLNQLDADTKTSQTATVYEGTFQQTMTGGELVGHTPEMTGNRRIAVSENYVRQNNLIHSDEIRFELPHPKDPVIISKARPEHSQASRYRDIEVTVKQRNYELYADTTVTGEPLVKVSPFKKYLIPKAYATATGVTLGDVVTLRYNTTAEYPSFRVVWLDFSHRRMSH